MAVLVQDLLGLWRGDEDTTGYADVRLATAICEKLRPASFDALLTQLYPDEDVRPPENDERRRIAFRGYSLWKTEKGG